jgi:hypothetical protein
MVATKYFTPPEAELTLPLVRKIVKDILDTTKEMRLYADGLNGKIEDNEQIKKMTRNVEGFLNELEEVGCFFKDWDFKIGLVDFPAIIDGREVYLCWRSDEDKIKFYHGVEEGYSNRMAIPENYLNN